MDELIDYYINTEFEGEHGNELRRALELLDRFNYPDRDLSLVRLLIDADKKRPEDVHDLFLKDIVEKTNELFIAHKLVLSPDVTLWQRNEFLSALIDVQSLVDYNQLLTLVESNTSDDEFIGDFFSQLSSLTPSECFTLITEFEPDFISLLKEFIKSKAVDFETSDAKIIIQKRIIENAKQFFNYQKDKILLSRKLIDDDVPIGLLFCQYMKIIKEDLIGILKNKTSNYLPSDANGKNCEVIFALNLLSLLYLAEDSFENPILFYRNISHELIANINQITRIDTLIIQYVSAYEEYKKNMKLESLLSK